MSAGSNAVLVTGSEPATGTGSSQQVDWNKVSLGAARGLATVMQARRPDLKWSVSPLK